jgi:hypothetical protein
VSPSGAGVRLLSSSLPIRSSHIARGGRLPMHGVHKRPATARGVASGITLLMVHGVTDYTGSGGHARGLRPRLQPGVAPNLRQAVHRGLPFQRVTSANRGRDCWTGRGKRWLGRGGCSRFSRTRRPRQRRRRSAVAALPDLRGRRQHDTARQRRRRKRQLDPGGGRAGLGGFGAAASARVSVALDWGADQLDRHLDADRRRAVVAGGRA